MKNTRHNIKDTGKELIDKDLLFAALENGIDTDKGYVKQPYICYVDGNFCIVDMQTDTAYLIDDFEKTWRLHIVGVTI